MTSSQVANAKNYTVTSIEISRVSLLSEDSESLWGHNIEVPGLGSCVQGHGVDVVGWVLGRNCPVLAVELSHNGTVFQRVPVSRRPDVAAVYTEVPWADNSGFRTTVRMLGITEFDLLVRAVLQDESCVRLGVIHGRCR